MASGTMLITEMVQHSSHEALVLFGYIAATWGNLPAIDSIFGIDAVHGFGLCFFHARTRIQALMHGLRMNEGCLCSCS